jgi:multiple sugar transport system substrate-binding protein
MGTSLKSQLQKRLSRRDFLRAAATSAGLTAAGLLPVRAQEEAQQLPAEESGTLSILHRIEYFEQVQSLFRQALEDFAVMHEIMLDASTFSPATGDFIGKMQAAVAAGNPPDLAYISGFVSVSQLHLLDLIADVTEVVNTLEGLYGSTMPGPSPHKNARFDGVWKAIPYLASCGAWFSRAGKLQAAGIDPLTDLDSYDQRRDAALAISDADSSFWGWGLTPNQSGDGYSFLIGVINAFGGHYTDSSGTIVEFESAETLAAVEWLTELYTGETYAPMLPPGILGWTDTSNNETYLAGAIGMTANAFSLYAQAKHEKNPVFADTVALRSPLTLDGRRQETSGNDWLIMLKGAANIELAKELALYLVDPVQFTPMAAEGAGLFMPAYEDLWTDALLAVDPNFATIKDIVSNPDPYIGHSWPAEPSAAIDAIRAASIPEKMMANIIANRMNPAEALANAQRQIVDIIEEGGLIQS